MQMGVSKNKGTPKSSILIRFSIINHPFWGTTIFGNIQMMPKSHRTWANYTFSWFSPSSQCLVTWRPASSNAARTWVLDVFWCGRRKKTWHAMLSRLGYSRSLNPPSYWSYSSKSSECLCDIRCNALTGGLITWCWLRWYGVICLNALCNSQAAVDEEHSVLSHYLCNVTFHRSSLMKMLQGRLCIVLMNLKSRKICCRWGEAYSLLGGGCLAGPFASNRHLVAFCPSFTAQSPNRSCNCRMERGQQSFCLTTWMSLALAMFGVISSVFLLFVFCYLDTFGNYTNTFKSCPTVHGNMRE